MTSIKKSLSENLSVAETFQGKSLFITGASGFMGKVLVEKLLRSCPGIVKIYVLIRPGKHGLTIKDKLANMKAFSCFDRLKTERPGDLETKLVAMEGDMTKLNLGLKVEDRNLLVKEVSIVYHAAATVQFNQPLKDAIIMNVRGTRELCKLVLNIRQTNPNTIMVHISTAYAHADMKVVEEVLYPPKTDWTRSIEIAEALDDFTIQILSAKYMDGAPNTYTFTKSLSERVVHDICGQGCNTVIVRPSIVISSAKEPMPGWIDNFNGPTAMVAATATGIIRISYVDETLVPDYMAVDIAIKAIILATWKQITDIRSGTASNTTNVYNCTASDVKKVSIKEMADIALKVSFEVALKDTLWYPTSATTKNKLWYYINVMIFHMIPAIIVDTGMSLFGIKNRSLVKVQRKIYTATTALAYFMFNQWEFLNNKMLALENALSDADIETFGYDVDNIDTMEYFRNAALGTKRFLLKEDMTQLDRDVAKTTMLYYLDKVVNTIFYLGLAWWIITKINLVQMTRPFK